jgi:hypothetical protein
MLGLMMGIDLGLEDGLSFSWYVSLMWWAYVYLSFNSTVR